MSDQFKGECLGTFLLVFFGCSAVASSVTVGAPAGLFQIAAVWGLGLTLAIWLTGGLSGAHLNPAITVAMAVFTKFSARRIPLYVAAQLVGAFLAAAAVYGLYGGHISTFETQHGIERGAVGSEASAMIFGEFHPNPGGAPLGADRDLRVSTGRAFFAEFLGTALLALAVFGLTHHGNKSRPMSGIPIAIGAVLTILICVFAPLTMAGFNPARDFGPRLFSSLAGWGSLPFNVNGIGWFIVYIVAPCCGALVGGFLATSLIWPRSSVD